MTTFERRYRIWKLAKARGDRVSELNQYPEKPWQPDPATLERRPRSRAEQAWWAGEVAS
jgi:hypothetical protein